jgi:putative glutamine amidotransferase
MTYGRDDLKVDSPLYNKHYSAPTPYVDAVRRAGGVPVLLPPGELHVDIWTQTVDAIIFAGGADIDPVRYQGNSDHPNLLEFSPDRDETEFALIKSLIADGTKPALFICRGMQLLNVALGGSLYEHLPDVINEDIHRGDDGHWTQQKVDVKTWSRLHDIMQASEVTTTSGHHQALREIGEGLMVVAAASDGVVEAVEIKDHPYFIGVQWHPEVTAEIDESQQRLFDELVSVAGARKRELASEYHPAPLSLLSSVAGT